MACFEQIYYCKNCKRNVQAENNKCKKCGGTTLTKSWSVRFRYINENGIEQQKRISGKATKKEAQDAYLQFMASTKKYIKKLENQQEDMTFEELYIDYKSYAINQLKESSYYDLSSKCDIHILPYFKAFKVKDLKPKVLLDWQNHINALTYGKQNNKKYSYKYKRNLRSYLRTILNYAEKYYQIPNNLKYVDNFKNNTEHKEMQVWTPEEFFKFIAQVDRPEYKAFFFALYFTGARKGEILATTWSDWDLVHATLNINKSVTKKTFTEEWKITIPKNQSSIRKIVIPPILVNEMKEYKLGREDCKLVFSDTKPLADSNIQRIMKEACQKAGVKLIRVHDLRHSHASLLLSQGISIVAVAKRLGHSNTEQTLNTYAHMLPSEESVLNNVLQNIGAKYMSQI